MPWPPPTVVLVAPELSEWPLWNKSPGRDPLADNDYLLDPVVLGVSSDLTQRLIAWNDDYISGIGVGECSGAWWSQGLFLAQELQREFDGRGLSVEVRYPDQRGQNAPVRDRPRRPRR